MNDNLLKEMMEEVIGEKIGKMTQMIFTERVIILAVLRKYGYQHEIGRSLILTQEEIDAATTDIKHLMDSDADQKAICSGVVTRPADSNGDGLELTIFTGPVTQMKKTTVAWQDERKTEEELEDAAPPAKPKKAVTKKK